ncbi:uncharacterized protein LOC135225723 isoform X2 [Macrobrachium nipponense]|uniref:uncharacterized protein LOC135225723 isoform X2 n=1 Tax=Macrobrachium nipponense TaxID=159736 RepID=UPI0030C85DFD
MEMTCMGTVGWLWIMQIVGLTKGFFQVPLIPGSVSEGDVTFLDIWNMELNHDISLERSVMKPGTILTPNDMAMIGLVPVDGPHPLYDDDEESVRLRKEFLLDHMALEVVNEDDPRMEDPEGLTVMNMNGKSLNFHKTDDGSVTVNGLLVHKIKTLDDETVIYEVDDLLFNHQDQVAEAFEAMTLSDPVDRRSEKSTKSRHHDEVTKSRHNDDESLQDDEITSNRLNVKVTEGREDVTEKHDKLTESLHNKEETEKEDSERLHDEVEKLRQNDKVTEGVRNVKVTEGRHDVTEKQNDKVAESLHDDVTKTRRNDKVAESLHDDVTKTHRNEKVAESLRNVKVTQGSHDVTEKHDDKVTESRVPVSLNNEGESKSLHNEKVTRSRRNVKVTEGRHNDDVTENLHNNEVTENLHNNEVTENLQNEVLESQRNEEVIGRQDVMKEDHKHSQCFAGK